jgi:hypothetical protein
VNGESMGLLSSENHIFVWADVKLKLGDNKLEAIGTKGDKHYSDTATIMYDPAAHVVRATTMPSASQP